MKILITGAGIGGLTAALCLLNQGYKVEIFEQAAELGEVGAGIQLGANAIRVLQHLGLQDKMGSSVVQPDAIDIKQYDSGKMLFHEPLGNHYARLYGAPYYHIHRADLHSILVDAVNQRAPNSIHLNSEFVSFSESADKVVLKLSDARQFEGDALIGADGLNSAVRQQLFGDVTAHWTGNVAWRGIVKASKLPDDFMEKVVTNFIGTRKHMVIYYLRQQQLVNFVGVVENDNWKDESWTVKSSWGDLKADFAGWHSTVQTLIDAVDKDQCFRWALFDRTPMDDWGDGRVTLLGDAAHATLPFLASGAAMAIEDGRVLARALSQAEGIEAGFQLYQRNRLQRTARIQTDSVKMGKLYHLPNKLALRAAFTAAKVVKRPTSWLAEYDANTVELI